MPWPNPVLHDVRSVRAQYTEFDRSQGCSESFCTVDLYLTTSRDEKPLLLQLFFPKEDGEKNLYAYALAEAINWATHHLDER